MAQVVLENVYKSFARRSTQRETRQTALTLAPSASAGIDRSLEQNSHSLLPLYVEKSLPLAIQCELERHQIFNSIQFNRSISWLNEPPDRNQIILAMLSELLNLTLPEYSTQATIQVRLNAQKRLAELIVQTTYFNQGEIATCGNSKELKYLAQSFRLLTSGWCWHRRRGQAKTWYFYWQLCTSSS